MADVTPPDQGATPPQPVNPVQATPTIPQAIADHFNETGVTTRKGRRWTGATVAKFLSSPGAKRYRSGEKAEHTVKPRENPDSGRPAEPHQDY